MESEKQNLLAFRNLRWALKALDALADDEFEKARAEGECGPAYTLAPHEKEVLFGRALKRAGIEEQFMPAYFNEPYVAVLTKNVIYGVEREGDTLEELHATYLKLTNGINQTPPADAETEAGPDEADASRGAERSSDELDGEDAGSS